MPTAKGKAYWAFVHKPKVNPEYNIDQYEITLNISKEEAKKLHNTGVEVKTTTPDDNRGFDGPYVVFKKNTKTRKGETNKPPTVVNKSIVPITDNIGNGSDVVVSYTPYAWSIAGKKGVKPLLNAVQVLNLIPYTESGVAEFENYDDDVADFS